MECRKFQDRRHLQRKSAYALASLCVSIKASYSLIQDTKRGFYFALDSCLIVMRDTEQGQARLLRGEQNEGKEKTIMETIQYINNRFLQ